MSEKISPDSNDFKIIIGYQKYSSFPSQDRKVEPYCVKLYRRRWYMLGRLENGDFRSFALDRITLLELTDEHFVMLDDFDAE